jgi:transposase
MRFYNHSHQFYVGIDLHARQMYLCVIDSDGEVKFHRNMPADAHHLARALQPFGSDIVVGVECVFTWYWIADFCANNDIEFVLGHALYMKAIHGGKSKSDKIDSHKIATMLRGGMLPMAYVYPHTMRSTRDLLRRRQYFVHQQSELLTHIQNTNTQYNLPTFELRLTSGKNRSGIEDRFADLSTRTSIEADLHLLELYHQVILDVEAQVKREAKHHDPTALHLLLSVPGVGPILALTILYEIHDISRFPSVGNFISYARLVKCPHESAGKRMKGGHNKIGNAHLKWAFSEAAVLFLRGNEGAKRLHQRLVGRYGKAKALSLLAQKLARTVYYMLTRSQPFDAQKFFADSVREPAA